MKYGSFTIEDDIAVWGDDTDVSFQLQNGGSSCLYEGFWNSYSNIQNYKTAISGVCIWGRSDCLFVFSPKGKGNPGAIRSFANPRDRDDIIKRLKKGDEVHKIIISSDPFGDYQCKTIGWQSGVVDRFSLTKLYYSIPFLEYRDTLDVLNSFLEKKIVQNIEDVLHSHYCSIKQYVSDNIQTEIEFVSPMLTDKSLTSDESYTWPYRNLDVDLGIEEAEEVRIPYQVKTSGRKIPPILLGILDIPSPYYEPRECSQLEIYVNE